MVFSGVDPEALIKNLLVQEKTSKTFVDVGLLDGSLIKDLARTTEHKLIGFEVRGHQIGPTAVPKAFFPLIQLPPHPLAVNFADRAI